MMVVFDEGGNLPPGVHWLSWPAFVRVFGWNYHRRQLVTGLRRALDDRHTVGCQTVSVDGSFVTTKEFPADFDACWDRTGVDMQRLPFVLLSFVDDRALQKGAYGGELFPADLSADMSGTRFIDFFQIDRESGRPKGIIALDIRNLP